MRFTRSATRLDVFALAAAAFGCTATITRFEAHPNVVCRGNPTTLSWEASDHGMISAAPADAGVGPVEARGNATVKPETSTAFVLRAEGCFNAPASQEVDVSVIDGTERIIGDTLTPGRSPFGCDAGTIWLIRTLGDEFWDPEVTVDVVRMVDSRPYRVEHGDAGVELAPGQTTHLFRGQSVRGPWRLSTPLQSGESCTTTTQANLSVGVTPICNP